MSGGNLREGMPLVDQYLLHVLPVVVRASGGAPFGSAEFRRALRGVATHTGLLPTRSETAAALRRLARSGLIEGPTP